MGCNFVFTNKTQNKQTSLKDLPVWLRRDIDRGAKSHLFKAFLKVIEIMKWNTTDWIEAECCCTKYAFGQTGRYFYRSLDPEWIYEEDTCEWVNCPVCSKDKQA